MMIAMIRLCVLSIKMENSVHASKGYSSGHNTNSNSSLLKMLLATE